MGERESRESRDEEQEERPLRPLASSSPSSPLASSTVEQQQQGRISSDEEKNLASSSSPKKPYKRRCIICCGCCAATVVILGLVIVILALTVFQVKDPVITMNSMNLERLTSRTTAMPPQADVNVTLTVGLSIRNPNVGSFKFGNSTTSISYGGRTVGAVHTPPGEARARRTQRLNVIVDVMVNQLVGDLNLIADLASGDLPLGSYTEIGGRVILLNIIRRHIDIAMNCTMTLSLTNRAIQNLNCRRSFKL